VAVLREQSRHSEYSKTRNIGKYSVNGILSVSCAHPYFPLFTTWINGVHTSAPCSLWSSGSALSEGKVRFLFRFLLGLDPDCGCRVRGKNGSIRNGRAQRLGAQSGAQWPWRRGNRPSGKQSGSISSGSTSLMRSGVDIVTKGSSKPPRWKMALLSWTAVWPVSMLMRIF
jgi:hypothetical protein